MRASVRAIATLAVSRSWPVRNRVTAGIQADKGLDQAKTQAERLASLSRCDVEKTEAQ